MLDQISLIEFLTFAAVLITLYWSYKSRRSKRPIISKYEHQLNNEGKLYFVRVYMVNTEEHNIIIKNVFLRKKVFWLLYGPRKEQKWELHHPGSHQLLSFLKDEGFLSLMPPDKILNSPCKVIVETSVGKSSIKYKPN
jgi:hypothetical protein